MDLAPEELQFLSIPDILRESISILKQSPKTFYLITLTLIFPLSFAILAHSLFTHPILSHLEDHPTDDPVTTRHGWTLLLVFQFYYIIFLFAFSLLSTAAIVVSVLEPIYGFSAMKKSYELLKGKARASTVLVFGYLAICGVIGVIFVSVVVHGGENHGVFMRIVVGGFLVGVLMTVILVTVEGESVVDEVRRWSRRPVTVGGATGGGAIDRERSWKVYS